MKIKTVILFLIFPLFLNAQNDKETPPHTVGLVFGLDHSSILTNEEFSINNQSTGYTNSKGYHIGFSYEYKLLSNLKVHTGFRLASMGILASFRNWETITVEIFNGTTFETVTFEDFVFRREEYQVQYLEIPVNLKLLITRNDYATLFAQSGVIGYYYSDNTLESSLDYVFLNVGWNLGFGTELFIEDNFTISLLAIYRQHMKPIKSTNEVYFRNLGIELGINYSFDIKSNL